jgi:23S rRNA-/tRNA-specific pseudouridylate synthase
MASLGHPIVGDDLHHSSRETASAGFTPLPDVVRGAGLFLHATGIIFYDAHGMRHSFAIDEPHKFSRFRHFCTLNRQKQIDRARRTSIDDRDEIDRTS